MSPEIVAIQHMWGNTSLPRGYSYPADVWALGIFMYNMLMGKQPFASKLSSREEKIKEIYDKTMRGVFLLPSPE